MGFRIEEKIQFHLSDYLKIKGFINKLGGKKIFPQRKILSLYFDNKNFSMFQDSEEGNLPRKKIRLRNYPNDKKNVWFLEKKISSVEGRFKKTIEKDIKYRDHLKLNGIYDPTYGNCHPQVWVSYFREYYSINNARLTLDQKIEYESYRGKKFYKDYGNLILELKSNNYTIKDLFDNLVPFQRIRFSKYCNAINTLFNKNEYHRTLKII